MVLFLVMAMWMAIELDSVHACLRDKACADRYRAKYELRQEDNSTYHPSAHPAYLNGRFQVLFF